jgi:serine/threonine-protein kinase RsbW
MTPPSRESLRLVIPSEPKRIAEADEFVESALRERGVPETLISDLAIAATEMVNNAIIHGNKKDAAKNVTIAMAFTSNEVEIRVEDQGNGFNPNSVPDPLAEENLLREVGRGIFIVRSLMDDMSYERTAEGGMAVVMRKTFESS